MSLYFSDLYVNTVSRGLLNPGEQLQGRVSARKIPWYAAFFRLPQFMTHYLVLFTNQRAVLVKHRRGWLTGDRMESVDSIPLQQVETAKMSGLFAVKKLRLRGAGVDLKLNVTGGFLEIKDNVSSGKALVANVERSRALPS
jgi:hypothetical protein